MIYLFTVGMSLSGKSWLVDKIQESFPKRFAVVDSRNIHDMLNKIGPFIDDNSTSGPSYDLRQKFTKEIRTLLIKLFAENNIDIIQDSCNLEKKARQERTSAVRKVVPNVKTILIYVNTSKEVIKSRAIKEDRKENKTVWQDLYNKQLEKFEIPSKDEADFFIEYNGKDWEPVIAEISKILNNGI